MNTDGAEVSSESASTGATRDGTPVPPVAVDAVEQGLASFDLTVLPKDTSRSGQFVYDEATADLVKELKTAGVDAGFAHDASNRLYYSERSADIAVAFLVNLGSAAVWEAFLRALESYRARKRLSVTLVHDKNSDGSESRSASFDGDGATVIEAMRAYFESQD